ncbi:hypothetical protein KSC_092660 [Ktedonobacter sp. SOSP1-52]|uniref:LuxR C-terminal-related transcriptional regulator n=1 Tax=Ktedonobacter sp. SOSP1-52 TaxID=2778366 RepID=UPI001915388F|nr:LuxR C-terminal-related transcriptional regulator [Ktedonobacter sp. SOSP1-52]GHO70374.1 hypothetical protein KSC_092660 [Ktedonobacter sp. SOSP1-52]
MPKPSLYVLTWSEEQQCYELTTGGQLQRSFRQEDESEWLAWLGNQTSFAFECHGGHLSIIKEDRPRGAGYWYAYSRQARRTHKCYVGRTATFARLEQAVSNLIDKDGTSAKLAVRTARAVAVSEPQKALPCPVKQGLASLLTTKLSPPQLPPSLVERKRLLKDLDATSSHRLVLLSAAAGSGKTTLLSMWTARKRASTQAIAWLSLEEQDNDPLRFWIYVIAALRIHVPGVGETALSMLQAPRSPLLSTTLTALINDLAACQVETVLILDDYHVINDPAIVSSFQFLLEHLPPRLHLVLAGRYDPQLALPRLRARGQVVELREQDLRFTRAEVVDFFTQTMKLPLAEVEIDVLEQRVEGWIAGLQLAALAMRARADYSTFVHQLHGGQRFILEYMQEEILEPQPQEVQDFLLHTAILTRLQASLCQAVVEGTSAQACQQMLRTLEKANLFLVPLDEERHWYRFHSLFRDMLQAGLQAIFLERIPVLHQRAARWYAQQGNTREAILHALAGSDCVFAADLMEQSAEHMCLNGEIAQLYAWITGLPDPLLLAHADLALTTTLQILLQALYDPDEQWNQAVSGTGQILKRIEMCLRSHEIPEVERHILQNRLDLLREWIASRDVLIQEDGEQIRLLSARLQELARDENVVWKMLPTYHLVAGEVKSVALLPLLSELKQQAEREQHPYEAIWMMERLGVIYRDRGQLRQAYQITNEALQRLQQMGKARSLFGYLHLHLAELHWTWSQLAEARTHLDAALQFARTWQHVDIQLTGCYQSIRMFLAMGQREEAEQALKEAEHLSQQSQWKHHRNLVMAGRALVWLAQGDLALTSAWAAHNEVNPHTFSYIHDEEYAEAIALVRVFLALRRNTDALHLLNHMLAHAQQNESIWQVVPVLALQAAALQASGEDDQARQVTLRLLQLAEPTDYLRVYLDAGTPLRQVLQSLLNPTITQHMHLLSSEVALKTLLAVFEQQADQEASLALPWSLTVRELEVFGLLAQGKTNQEIADQLVVSLATAKKHVSNILSKLGAENRAQAIARVREMPRRC